MIVYRVAHESLYHYTGPVLTSHSEAHLLPRRLERQDPRRVELRIDPTPDSVSWHTDYFGNDVVFFALETPHEQLRVHTESVVEVRPPPPLDGTGSTRWEESGAAARAARTESALAAFEFVFDSPLVTTGAALADYARPSFPPGRPLADGLRDLGHRIYSEFRYDASATTLETTLAEVLEARHGVCQDFAHVMIGALRSLGIPARYVSGYLRSPEPRPEGGEPAGAMDASGGTPLVGAESSHAWVAAWDPVHGWLEVDPTNDVVPAERHVVLGWGRDYDDVSPVKGVTLGGGAQTVEVSVSVMPA